MSNCRYCYGVLGRDCFNEYDCGQVTASMQSENEIRLEQENTTLRGALQEILNSDECHEAWYHEIAKKALGLSYIDFNITRIEGNI